VVTLTSWLGGYCITNSSDFFSITGKESYNYYSLKPRLETSGCITSYWLVKERLTLMSSLFLIKYKIKKLYRSYFFGHPVDSTPSAAAYIPLTCSFIEIYNLISNSILYQLCFIFFIFGATTPQWARASSFTRFLDHTRHTKFDRTPLDEWSARHRDLCLTTNNTHNRQKFMPPAGCEPKISAEEPPQTYALDSAVTGTGSIYIYKL